MALSMYFYVSHFIHWQLSHSGVHPAYLLSPTTAHRAAAFSLDSLIYVAHFHLQGADDSFGILEIQCMPLRSATKRHESLPPVKTFTVPVILLQYIVDSDAIPSGTSIAVHLHVYQLHRDSLERAAHSQAGVEVAEQEQRGSCTSLTIADRHSIRNTFPFPNPRLQDALHRTHKFCTYNLEMSTKRRGGYLDFRGNNSPLAILSNGQLRSSWSSSWRLPKLCSDS
ncbi:hypothetical protein C8R47DRAFT_1136005 [Mycena vitilis]|nr:hypothetical protein C8R47DRAFT_1136005 [Mycena vitilis]